MKMQTILLVALGVGVLWFTWEYILATVLWLFGLGVTMLIFDLAPTVVLLVLAVVALGIWNGGKWLIERAGRRR